MSDSVRPHRQQPTRLPRPWDSPSKNTGVGCHFLLQCMKGKVKVKLLSHVRLFATPWTAAYQAPPSMGFSRQKYWSGARPLLTDYYIKVLPKYSCRDSSVVVALVPHSCPTLCDPMDSSLPGSSVHGILQGRIWERVAILFSRGSS